MSFKRLLVGCFILLFTILIILLAGWHFIVAPLLCPPDSCQHIYTARDFIEALAQNEEEKAFSYLSTDLKAYVLRNCEAGQVTRCFDEIVQAEWGTFKDTWFRYGRPRTGAMGFYVNWSNKPGLFAVILVHKENNRWVVNGWRGFTQETDGLIDGTNQTNAFPPEEI